LTNLFVMLALAGLLLMAGIASVLYFLTLEIRRSVDRLATVQPGAMVTATLEPGTSSRSYSYLVLTNCGEMPAFDVRVRVTPQIPTDDGVEERPADWSDLSLLRPGQSLASYGCETERLADREFAVSVSWLDRPDALSRSSLDYRINTGRIREQAPLPATDPSRLLAELKRIRRDWQPVAQGRKSLQISLPAQAPSASSASQKRPSENAAEPTLKRSTTGGKNGRADPITQEAGR
jgi:hypothetical protein